MRGVGAPDIDGFVVAGQIGQGTTASVWLARQAGLDRWVAIKVHDGPRSPGVGERRMAREGRAVARLDHPHIVRVFRTGHRDGVPYVILEYVAGPSLSAIVGRQPLGVGHIRELLGQLSSALSYAHRSGVVHRDVKPSNVLLAPHGQWKLTDFGLAKVRSPDGLGGPPALTRPGVLVGTARYMAPEAIEDASRAGPPSDLYSLACLTYELFSGRPPFGHRAGLLPVLQAQLHSTPLPLSSIAGAFPGQVEAVILRALAKAPEDRPPDVAAYWRDLDQAGSEAWPEWGSPSRSDDRCRSPVDASDGGPQARVLERRSWWAPDGPDSASILIPSPVPAARRLPAVEPTLPVTLSRRARRHRRRWWPGWTVGLVLGCAAAAWVMFGR